KRVDVHLPDLGNVDRDLRDLDQRKRHRLDICARPAAETCQQLVHACAANQGVGEVEVERRQLQGNIGHDLDGGTAVTEQDCRAEGGIVGKSEEQLGCIAVAEHRLELDAGDLGLRMQ